MKNSETLTQLQLDIDRLNRRNKFLESELEVLKEEGESEVLILQENCNKDLNEQLKRQSMKFLSSEQASKSQMVELEQKNEELRNVNDDLHRQIAEHCTEIKSWVSEILLLSEEEYNEEFHTISDVLAKLQKIIINDKRKIDELQEELDAKENEDLEDTLSQSWAGFSWNNAESQKNLCCNCRQKKLRRILKGSFDLGEMGIDVQQEDLDGFIENIDVNERKYHKRQSLRDSLELAETRSKLKEMLGEEKWTSLETLGEKSLEIMSSLEGLPSLSETGDSSSGDSKMKSGSLERNEGIHGEDEELPLIDCNGDDMSGGKVGELGNEVDKGLGLKGEDGGFKGTINGLFDVVDGLEETKDEPVVVEQGGWEGKMDVATGGERDKMFNGDRFVKDKKEERGVKSKERPGFFENKRYEEREMADEEEEEDDVVHVVNLYRSLLSPSFNDQPIDDGVINNDVIDNDHNSIDNDYNASDNHVTVMVDGRYSPCLSFNDQRNDKVINNNDEAINQERSKVRVNYVFNYSPCLSFSDQNSDDNIIDNNLINYEVDDIGNKLSVGETDDHEIINNNDINIQHYNGLSNHWDMTDNQDTREPEGSSGSNIPSDPIVTSETDHNGNLPQFYINGKKQDASVAGNDNVSSVVGDKGDQLLQLSDHGVPNLDEKSKNTQNENELRNVSEKFKNSEEVSQKKCAEKQNHCSGLCSHCSDILLKNSAGYEKTIEKLLEFKTLRERDEELEIFRELDQVKEDVKRYQKQYEALEKVCEDYQKRIHEYSENIRNKNSQLRKLQVISSVMKTEVEWLRHALNVTTNYGDM